MANGLLSCSWIEYWEPNLALGSLKGMINGLDFPTNPDMSVVNLPAFPSGKAVMVDHFNRSDIFTASDPLLTNWGATDFLAMLWSQANAATPGVQPDVSFTTLEIGESAADGVGLGISNTPFPKAPLGYIPGSDESYPTVDGVAGSYTAGGAPHCILFWWTALDQTLHIQMDGGAEHTFVSPVGPGTPDITASANLNLVSGGTLDPDQRMFAGDMGVCKAPIPDATQRALLFGGLPFSQWDNGGGGPGTEDCRASAIMVSLPWRGMYPQPDGTIGLGDRIQTAFMYRCIADPPPSGNNNNEVFYVGGHPHMGGHHSICRVG